LKLIQNQESLEFGFELALARGFYKADDYEMAEYHFLQVIDEPIFSPLDFKALSICLLINSKLSLAQEISNLYRRQYPENTVYSVLWSQVSDYFAEQYNSKSTALTNYQLFYGSVNSENRGSFNLDHGSVKAQVSCLGLENIEGELLPIEDFSKIGTYTIGPNNSLIYSQLNSDGLYQLFIKQFSKGKYKKAVRLDFGEMDANYAFPLFDKNFLYFSSDKVGGVGGYDLYRTKWRGKNFEDLQNAGKFINTEKNEILPSVFNSLLTFSSNGHPGFGGYDVYFVSDDLNKVHILPYPYNSGQNQLTLVNLQNSSAQLIQIKDNKVNLHQTTSIETFERKVQGKVLTLGSSGVVSARIMFSHNLSKQGYFVETDVNGDFNIMIPTSISAWNVEIWHEDFINPSFMVDLKTLGDKALIIMLDPEKQRSLGTVFIRDSLAKNVIPTAPVIELNQNQLSDTESVSLPFTNQLEDSTQVDVFDEFNDTESRYYVIFGSTRSYNSAYAFWQKWRNLFPNAEILEDSENGIYRVGEYAGYTQNEAMIVYQKAKKLKSDVWILRPDQQN
jgi:hypothetical protein